jgi:hypothetical protein
MGVDITALEKVLNRNPHDFKFTHISVKSVKKHPLLVITLKFSRFRSLPESSLHTPYQKCFTLALLVARTSLHDRSAMRAPRCQICDCLDSHSILHASLQNFTPNSRFSASSPFILTQPRDARYRGYDLLLKCSTIAFSTECTSSTLRPQLFSRNGKCINRKFRKDSWLGI